MYLDYTSSTWGKYLRLEVLLVKVSTWYFTWTLFQEVLCTWYFKYFCWVFWTALIRMNQHKLEKWKLCIELIIVQHNFSSRRVILGVSSLPPIHNFSLIIFETHPPREIKPAFDSQQKWRKPQICPSMQPFHKAREVNCCQFKWSKGTLRGSRISKYCLIEIWKGEYRDTCHQETHSPVDLCKRQSSHVLQNPRIRLFCSLSLLACKIPNYFICVARPSTHGSLISFWGVIKSSPNFNIDRRSGCLDDLEKNLDYISVLCLPSTSDAFTYAEILILLFSEDFMAKVVDFKGNMESFLVEISGDGYLQWKSLVYGF